MILFADDTTLLYSHPDISSKIDFINKELFEISNWFKANKLSVNASKTNYIIMGTSHITNKYVNVSSCTQKGIVKNAGDVPTFDSDINNHLHKQKVNVISDNVSLDRVTSTKFLGVIIDERLTWKKHIDTISKTISRNIGIKLQTLCA